MGRVPFGGVWPLSLVDTMVEETKGTPARCPGWKWHGKPVGHTGPVPADRVLVATCKGVCGGWVAPVCQQCCDAIMAATATFPTPGQVRRAKAARLWRKATFDPEPDRFPWQTLACPLCAVIPGFHGFVFRDQLRVEALPTRVAR